MSHPESLSPRFLTTAQRHVLLAGLLTGAAASVFPACGNILTDVRTYAFSSTQYGSLFVVQTLLAIFSSLVSSRINRSISQRNLLKTGLLSSAVAMLLLVSSNWLPVGNLARYSAVILASAFMGIGIGFGISVANVLSASAWNEQPQRGVAALHTMLGLGLSLSPFGVSAGLAIGNWWLAPVTIVLLLIWLASRHVVMSNPVPIDTNREIAQDNYGVPRAALPRVVIMLGLLAFLYGIAEATFSNWCVIYLYNLSGVGISAAGLVLSGFWGAVMIGRLIYTTVSVRVGGRIAAVSPLLMSVSFLIISLANNSTIQAIGFIIAGAACASVYPALLGRASTLHTSRRQLVSGLMVATVLAGTGAGTYLTAAVIGYFDLDLPQVYRIMAAIPVIIFTTGFLPKKSPDSTSCIT